MKKPIHKLAVKLTILGGLPLLMLLCLPHIWWLSAQLVAQIYLAIILAFIAGIDWVVALNEGKLSILIWSVVLSLLPWVVVVLSMLTTKWLLGWLLLWMVLNLAWAIDRYRVPLTQELLSIRAAGSITLNLVVLLIVLRLSVFS